LVGKQASFPSFFVFYKHILSENKKRPLDGTPFQ
jgi:hypothetical protein